MKLQALMLAATVAAIPAARGGQPAASMTAESLLRDRLGVAPAEVGRFAGGEILARIVSAAAPNEIAAVGAMRTKGDLRRLLAWFHDIEAFMRAAGTQNVGAVQTPVSAADFARVPLDDADFSDLAACRPGRCEIRMPPAYLERFQKEVNWKSDGARAQSTALARSLIAEYVSAYQAGGDAALGKFHNQQQPNVAATQFQDLLRRATKAWDLAYPFVSYLETYPGARPEGTIDRFYWTRDQLGRKPVLTLHHVAIQEFPDGRLLLADKQFYASRDLDAALMIALAIPTADKSAFDLMVSVKARADAVSGVGGRLLKGRIEKGLVEAVAGYLKWIRDSFALG